PLPPVVSAIPVAHRALPAVIEGEHFPAPVFAAGEVDGRGRAAQVGEWVAGLATHRCATSNCSRRFIFWTASRIICRPWGVWVSRARSLSVGFRGRPLMASPPAVGRSGSL